MLKIGQFSRLTGISIRSLRHYDQIGLLKPRRIDHESGYRYYERAQLQRAHRLLALKALGLSLEQVSDLLSAELTPDEIRALFRRQQRQLRQQIALQQYRLRELDLHLAQIEHAGRLDHIEFVVKHIPARRVIIRDETLHASQPVDIAGGYYAMQDKLAESQIPYGEAIGLLYAVASDGTFMLPPYDAYSSYHFSYVYEVDGCGCDVLTDLHGNPFYADHLPALQQVASALYRGSYGQRGIVSDAFARWASLHDYRLSGPVREIYYQVVGRDPMHSDNLVEIQFPIVPYMPPNNLPR